MCFHTKSIRLAATELQVPRSTVHKIQHKNLQLYTYKVQLLQALKPNDKKGEKSLQLTCLNEFLRMKHSSDKFVSAMRQPFMFQGNWTIKMWESGDQKSPTGLEKLSVIAQRLMCGVAVWDHVRSNNCSIFLSWEINYCKCLPWPFNWICGTTTEWPSTNHHFSARWSTTTLGTDWMFEGFSMKHFQTGGLEGMGQFLPNLQALDWVHCEEETGAYAQLSRNTYKLVKKITNF